jgi:hypothetical protein
MTFVRFVIFELVYNPYSSDRDMLLFLPPYLLDLSPIEESFSTWKAYLCRHGKTLRGHDNPIFVLLNSLGCVTAEMALNWFWHSGYKHEYLKYDSNYSIVEAFEKSRHSRYSRHGRSSVQGEICIYMFGPALYNPSTGISARVLVDTM